MTYSRRQFLSTVPTAAVGSFFLTQAAPAITQPNPNNSNSPQSGLASGQPIPFPHLEIPGVLSAAQLQVHHDKHYTGALNGYHKLDAELIDREFDKTGYTARLRTRPQKANSTLLHELYFSGVAPQSTAPDNQLTTAIQNRFGSIECWWEDFQAAAVSSRG